MEFLKQLNKRLFVKYDQRGIVERSSAQFLFIIALIFFILMALTFFIFIGRVDFIRLLASCLSSIVSSAITMILIRNGKLTVAASFFVLFQCLVSAAGLEARTPDVTLVTVMYFVYPTLVLAAMFAPRAIQVIVVFFIISLFLWNNIRIDENAVEGVMLRNGGLVRVGTVMGIISIILTYAITYFVMNFLRLAISASDRERKITGEKNSYITQLLGTIRNSYHELNDLISSTEGVIEKIFVNTQTQAATVEELAASMEQISANTGSVDSAARGQNDSVEELSGSIKVLNDLINSLHVYGTGLQSEFSGITSVAEKGKASSESVIRINDKIMMNSVNMQGIADIIDDFFERINLLSLNASIEAARAGEHGRGFAVVADEVGKLADNSSSELNKIRELISTNRKDIESAGEIIGGIVNFIDMITLLLPAAEKKASDTLDVISRQKQVQGDMLEKTGVVRNKSAVIKSASSEQSAAINEIVMSIESTSTVVQNTAGLSQSLKSSYDRLRDLADKLNLIITGDVSVDAVSV